MALDVGAAFRIRASVDGQAQLDRFNKSLKDAGQQGQASAGQIRAAMNQLPAQFTDIATQLAGGQSPFLIMLQQGGQIRDSFGGVGNALRGIAGAISPVGLAVGAAAAAVGTLALAFIKGEAESVNFNRALEVTNNFAGQTADRFNAAALRVEENARVTAGAARELTQAVVAGGRFGPESVELVATAMANLQRVTGLATKDVQQQFSGLTRSASDWSAEMNRTYNFLDVAQYRYIRSLEEAGDKEGAQRVAVDLLNRSLSEREQNLGTLQRLWRDVASAAGSAWQAMLNIGREDTIGEQIAELEQRLRNADELRQRARARGMNISGESPEIAAIRAQLQALREAQRMQEMAADTSSQRARENQRAIEEERKLEQERGRAATQRVSDFDRLKQQLGDQLLSTRELGVAETLLAQIQAGRYKELSAAQRDELLAIARTIDARKEEARNEEEARQAREAVVRARNQTVQAESNALDAAKQRWMDIIEPIGRYMRMLEEINRLGSLNLLDPDQVESAKQWVEAQIKGVDKVKDTTKDATKEMKDAIQGWGRDATNAFVEFAFGAKTNFSDLVNSILKDIARMAIQKRVTDPLFKALDASLSGFFPQITPNANGGIVGPGGPVPLRAYSRGGVADRPQMALFGEGSLPEAYVPLPDGRTIPVTMKGSGGSVQVVVNNFSGAQASARETVDSRGNRRVEVTVSEMVAGEMARPGSSVNSAVRNSFGARPALVGR